MGGKALMDYIADRQWGHYRFGVSKIASMADANTSTVSNWKNHDQQPSFKDVLRLGNEMQQRYPSLGVNAHCLLKVAGYDVPPDPKAVEFQQFVNEWNEVTSQLYQAGPHQQKKALREVRKILD